VGGFGDFKLLSVLLQRFESIGLVWGELANGLSALTGIAILAGCN